MLRAGLVVLVVLAGCGRPNPSEHSETSDNGPRAEAAGAESPAAESPGLALDANVATGTCIEAEAVSYVVCSPTDPAPSHTPDETMAAYEAYTIERRAASSRRHAP